MTLTRSVAGSRGYQQVYALEGDPGSTWIQIVCTEAGFDSGGTTLVGYRGAYAEYFQLDEDGVGLSDRHEFDVQRDGWGQDRIRDVLARAGVRGPSGSRLPLQAPAVWARKRFLIVAGAVEQAEPSLRGSRGKEFGFLAEGPCAPAANLTVSAPGAERVQQPALAIAAGYRARGRGRLTAAVGWTLAETFRFDFATSRMEFDPGGGYAQTRVADVGLI